MNRSVRLAAALAVLAAAPVRSSPAASGEGLPEADDADDHPRTAQALLRRVREALPDGPVTLRGDCTVRAPSGRGMGRTGFVMQADWSARPARLICTLHDASDRETERVDITLASGAPAVFARRAPDGRVLDPPRAGDPIGSTTLTWGDLALSFLWWPGGELDGTGRVKGQVCDIVRVPAPAGDAGPSPYASVRLYVSRDFGMLMRADGVDAQGDLVRSLSVRSLRKAEGHWVISELEARGAGLGPVTRLRIRDVAWPEGP